MLGITCCNFRQNASITNKQTPCVMDLSLQMSPNIIKYRANFSTAEQSAVLSLLLAGLVVDDL